LAESVRAALKTKAEKKESFRFPLELIDELIDIRMRCKDTSEALIKNSDFCGRLNLVPLGIFGSR